MDEWYDEECRAARKKKKEEERKKKKEKNVRKPVRTFRTLLDRLVCVDYCCVRREYKKPCCDKRKGSSMKMC